MNIQSILKTLYTGCFLCLVMTASLTNASVNIDALTERATADDSALAQVALGKIYQAGTDDVTKDTSKAIEWFEMAVEKEYRPAYEQLGLIYLKGVDIEPDPEQAYELLSNASDLGSSVAQYEVGRMYFNGKAVDKDVQEAIRLLKLAAEQGNTDALIYMGDLLTDDKNKKELAEFITETPFSLYLTAAKAGDSSAQFKVGEMYDTGNGVKKSSKTSSKWYRKAANAGHSRAKLRLTGCKRC